MDERPDPQTSSDEGLLSFALGATILGALIMVSDYLVGIPIWVTLVGASLFLLGVVVAGVIGFRVSRRTGAGILRSLAHGLRVLWSWLWRLLP